MRVIRWRFIISLCIGVFMTACAMNPDPEEACNFVQNGKRQRVSWGNHLPVVLYAHRSVPVGAIAPIERAIESWNASQKKTLLAFGGLIDDHEVAGKDGSNVIYWQSTWDEAFPSEQARTTIYWFESEIYEADVMINAKNFVYSFETQPDNAQVDLESLLLHEFGHVLGLAHTGHRTKSVMVEQLMNGKMRRAPESVDSKSLTCEY